MSKPKEKLNDREIIDLFKDGDQSVFGVLVKRYLSKAYQISFGILGNRQDAEEVSQDVFVRIYKALPKFRGDAEFSTWMYMIALNLARNKYRWNKSRGAKSNVSLQAGIGGEDETSSLEHKISDGSPMPDEKVGLDEFERNVMAEMERLPALYKEALILRNIEEMSYEQIASVLGCRIGTIKSRIARAREELRTRLGM